MLVCQQFYSEAALRMFLIFCIKVVKIQGVYKAGGNLENSLIHRKVGDLDNKLRNFFLEQQIVVKGLSLLTSKRNPENFRSISQRLAILQTNL